MARFLVIIALGFVVWLLVRSRLRKPPGPGTPPPGQAPVAEDMVACALCGVNMPRSEAREEGGRITCRDPASCRHAG